jgi:phosphoribosylformylglycinamidine (FGAM) synthase-like enzyme
MAVAEAITNIVAADITARDVRLSANWMAACGEPGEDADLYDTVRAVGEEFCPALGIAIPVGKDSLSMKTAWTARGTSARSIAPVSLIVSAFAPVRDVRAHLDSATAHRSRRHAAVASSTLGTGAIGSAAPVSRRSTARSAREAPDCDDRRQLRAFVTAHRQPPRRGSVLAYHDRSDGGLFVTLAEMAFAGHCGVAIDLRAAQQRRGRARAVRGRAGRRIAGQADRSSGLDVLAKSGSRRLQPRSSVVSSARPRPILARTLPRVRKRRAPTAPCLVETTCACRRCATTRLRATRSTRG